MKALIYAAVLNGVVAVSLIFLIALISANKKIMGKYKNRSLSNILIWMTFGAMLASSVLLLFTFWVVAPHGGLVS